MLSYSWSVIRLDNVPDRSDCLLGLPALLRLISCVESGASFGGTSKSAKPSIITTQPPKSHQVSATCRNTRSTTALSGMPRMVPMEMNRGYVKATPKLIKKLKPRLSAEDAHRKPQGIDAALPSGSTPGKTKIDTIN